MRSVIVRLTPGKRPGRSSRAAPTSGKPPRSATTCNGVHRDKKTAQAKITLFCSGLLVKCRKLGKACGIILFKRLQFHMPLLGRSHQQNNEKQNLQIQETKAENRH